MSRKQGKSARNQRRLGLMVLGGVALGAAFVLGLLWGGGSPPRPPAPQPAKQAGQAAKAKPRIKPKAKPQARPAPAPAPARQAPRPKVALIIDDMGNGNEPLERLLALKLPLTISVLPHTPQGKQVARRAFAAGLGVMLHLPMEPQGYPSLQPGPGALLCAMPPEKIRAVVKEDLASVPHAAGVNNHMGSRFSRRPELLEVALGAIKRRGLFYVDSFTSADSQGLATAQRLGLATARRDVFLDHDNQAGAIERQLERLLKIARKRGRAIAIGHPLPATLRALERWAPRLQKEVELVKVEDLVKIN